MRWIAILACGAAAACTTGDVVPPGEVIYQVPAAPSASSSSGAAFTGGYDPSSVENALGGPGVVNPGAPPVPVNAAGTPLDDDRLNLTLYTIEQQKVDAAIAERQLAEARSQLVIMRPEPVPRGVEGVNIALYAQQTTNAVGERIYARSRMGVGGGCGRFRAPDEAQRAFLASGGPAEDPRGLDPDGDGFACSWDPGPYRALRG